MKKRLVILLFSVLFSVNGFSQKNQVFRDFEVQLKELMNLIFDSPTDNERFNANERFIVVIDEVLSMENSFSYPFSELNRISNLKSSDNRFRIFTWAIVSQDGNYDHFGFVQAKNEVSGEFEVYKLNDKSEELFNPEYDKCDNDNWFGAVYFELLTEKYEDRTFYTLLGVDGHNIYTKRKVIEPIVFKPRSGKPEFGATYFYRQKDKRRSVFEYNADARFFMKWDDQYYEDKYRKEKPSFISSVFKKKQPQARNRVVELPIFKEYMIVYDVLEPMFEGLEGKPQFYVSSGYVNGFKFERGRWRLIESVLPRNQDKKDPPKIENKSNQLYNPK
ncbi:MAG TPA: hypothetical protein GX005_07760 [Bacteroidales bacterium]|nr:hypothetical protein [Bacteroidales bacterium]